MRSIRLPLLAVSCVAALAATGYGCRRQTDDALPLIPLPVSVQKGVGAFTVRPGTAVIVAPEDGEVVAPIARLFIERVRKARGLELSLEPETRPQAGIALRLDSCLSLAPEGYRLEVAPDGIRVRAATPAGLFYGTVTLLQLLTPDARQGEPVSVPSMTLRDEPRFPWRGLMLDVARHYMPPGFVKQLIDWMSLHKLNVFHWHLTDDQGWRLQILRFPLLTEVGAHRSDSPGGFYTHEQVRDIVDYAAQRFVTVVPEIDMPGHMQAAIAAYPWLGSSGGRPPVSTEWGVHPYLLNVDERTFTFLGQVLDEVVALFPGAYVHVGGDEAVKDQWTSSPAIQERMHALGVKDEEALQGYFVQRLGAMLHARGRKLIGWDEIVDAGLPPEATVMSWRGLEGGTRAARSGHDVVISPYTSLYLDYLQSNGGDEPAGRPEPITLADVYSFDPMPARLTARQARHIQGVQANVWTEYIETPAQVEYAVFPRIAALAEIAWSSKRRPWTNFLTRLVPQLARYRVLGIRYAESALAVRLDIQPESAGRIEVSMANQAAWGDIFYTLDGQVPTPRTARYKGPLSISLPAQISAAAYAGGELLASPTRRVLDAKSLRQWPNEALAPCSNDYLLRLSANGHDGGWPAFLVDVLNPCWKVRGASLDKVSNVKVRLERVRNNLLLGKRAGEVVKHTARTPHGEVEIHRDACNGPLLVSVPVSRDERPNVLSASFSAQSGSHDLCLFVTANPPGYLWVVGSVELGVAP